MILSTIEIDIGWFIALIIFGSFGAIIILCALLILLVIGITALIGAYESKRLEKENENEPDEER